MTLSLASFAASAQKTSAPAVAPGSAPDDTQQFDPPGTMCISSSENQVVGIRRVADATCVHGGAWCDGTRCRLCKFRETPQSAHLQWCSPIEQVSANRTLSSTTSTTSCDVSPGDAAVGIQSVIDFSCTDGGIGCYDGSCRYCRDYLTPKSEVFDPCSSYSNASASQSASSDPTGAIEVQILCAMKPSDGDAAVGIDITNDPDCENGGIGCIDSTCRFCRLALTTKSADYLPCSNFEPVTPTAATPPNCTMTVSDGDAANGIQIYTDSSCADGGVGCIDEICRFCKRRSTSQSEQFQSCPQSTSTNDQTPTGAASEVDSSTASMGGSQDGTDTEPAIPLSCDQTVTEGDAAVGIQIVSDITCGDHGIGCITSICRFCQVFETAKSAVFLNCSTIEMPDLSDITLVRIPTYEETVMFDTATTSANDISTECLMAVSAGDAAVGLSIEADLECVTMGGGVGCLPPSACKFCKRFDTPESVIYDYCTNFGPEVASKALASTTSPIFSLNADHLYVAAAASVGILAVVAVVVYRMLGGNSQSTSRDLLKAADPRLEEVPAESTNETQPHAAIVVSDATL